MKVKVKKEGKIKEFKLISSWEDVTLEKWLQLIDFETVKEKTASIMNDIDRIDDIRVVTYYCINSNSVLNRNPR